MIVTVAVALAFVTQGDPTATATATEGVPLSLIVDLLVDYIPDLKETSSRPDSVEYCTIEFLSLDNGQLFTTYKNGTFFLIESITTLLQRYVMAEFYFEQEGFGTNSTITTDWLSSAPTCFWIGLICHDTNGLPGVIGAASLLFGTPSIAHISLSGKHETILSRGIPVGSLLAHLISIMCVILFLHSAHTHIDGEVVLGGTFPTVLGLLSPFDFLNACDNTCIKLYSI
jgi:hypothetical protein